MNRSTIILTEGYGSDMRILKSGGVELLFDGDLALRYPLLRTVNLLDMLPLMQPCYINSIWMSEGE